MEKRAISFQSAERTAPAPPSGQVSTPTSTGKWRRSSSSFGDWGPLTSWAKTCSDHEPKSSHVEDFYLQRRPFAASSPAIVRGPPEEDPTRQPTLEPRVYEPRQERPALPARAERLPPAPIEVGSAATDIPNLGVPFCLSMSALPPPQQPPPPIPPKSLKRYSNHQKSGQLDPVQRPNRPNPTQDANKLSPVQESRNRPPSFQRTSHNRRPSLDKALMSLGVTEKYSAPHMPPFLNPATEPDWGGEIGLDLEELLTASEEYHRALTESTPPSMGSGVSDSLDLNGALVPKPLSWRKKVLDLRHRLSTSAASSPRPASSSAVGSRSGGGHYGKGSTSIPSRAMPSSASCSPPAGSSQGAISTPPRPIQMVRRLSSDISFLMRLTGTDHSLAHARRESSSYYQTDSTDSLARSDSFSFPRLMERSPTPAIGRRSRGCDFSIRSRMFHLRRGSSSAPSSSSEQISPPSEESLGAESASSPRHTQLERVANAQREKSRERQNRAMKQKIRVAGELDPFVVTSYVQHDEATGGFGRPSRVNPPLRAALQARDEQGTGGFGPSARTKSTLPRPSHPREERRAPADSGLATTVETFPGPSIPIHLAPRLQRELRTGGLALPNGVRGPLTQEWI